MSNEARRILIQRRKGRQPLRALTLQLADAAGLRWAQAQVTAYHYLHTPVDVRCSPEAYLVRLDQELIGCLIFGRPQATRVSGWYGTLAERDAGACSLSYWEVINLARIWFDSRVQVGGALCHPDLLPVPGFYDRKGVWRTTLASTCIDWALEHLPVDYLRLHPPVWVKQPYALRECLSYCDPSAGHRGTLYHAAHFTLLERAAGRSRSGRPAMQTYRRVLRELSDMERQEIERRAAESLRSRTYRAQAKARASAEQLAFPALGLEGSTSLEETTR